MRTTKAETRDFLAKAATEAGISASPEQLDKATTAFIRAENVRKILKLVFVAGVIALAVAWYVFR